FLIDHRWFIEADEHLPRHKEPPAVGGDHPFMVSSGHNRWSIHSLNTSNRLMLETHRGTPHLVVNTAGAEELGLSDNDEVRVWNDQGSSWCPSRPPPRQRPKQVVMYNGFDNFSSPTGRAPTTRSRE
ncbi:MAG: hypothetical protein M5U19_14795, partial [Microthrixaceae bacterium]|nr:hypothetical protein [Microthrixaceae bacterium]